ncbi:MAG: N-acetylmuramoyl-L-alanine amidase [Thermoleophilia bacterium]|nr:N-acetylmuramoyl-L-alanine amidase [Thermoleophilia bacterium]
MRGRYKYFTGTAVVVLLLIAAFFVFPGFGSQTSHPEAISGDFVQTGTDFESGESSGTGVVPVAGSRELALSLQPAQPQGSYLSEPIAADYTFNALGLHWKADQPSGADVAVEVRFSQDGSQWGDWQPVSEVVDELPNHFASTKSAGETIGDLIFTDAGRFFQYRIDLTSSPTGQVPVVTKMTASYIDSRGYHNSQLSLSNISQNVRDALAPASASADLNYIPRTQWGANDAYTQANWPSEYAQPKKIILHHTAGSNYDPNPFATVLGIWQYHAVSLGWGDIGYNFLVDELGRVYEGRMGGNGVVGAHALGWNTGSVGISVMGNYEAHDINTAIYNAVAELMTIKANQNQIDPYGNSYFVHYEGCPDNCYPVGGYSSNILGHRDLAGNYTACPGDSLYAYLPYFRTAAYINYSPIPIVAGIRVKWDSLNGAPGPATGAEYCLSNPGGQCPLEAQAQDFQNGIIIWNPAGGVYWIHGGILEKYNQLGGASGSMGLPRSDEYGVAEGRGNDFAGGRIYWCPGVGTHAVTGAILAKLLSDGGVARDGFPTTDEYDVPGYAGTRAGDFQRARIYWSASGSSRTVIGGILGKYLALGGPASPLGLPVSDESDISGLSGGRQSEFTNGRIYWAPGVGVYGVYGAILTKYLALGGPAGSYGMPTSDEYAAANGRAQNLQRGTITWEASLGAHSVIGGIQVKYAQFGGPAGSLGLATSDEGDVSGVSGARESAFQRGRIYWAPVTGGHAVMGAIFTKYLALGGPAGLLGLPLTDEYDISGVTGGRESDFQQGRIYYHATTGTYEVYGGILGKYLQLGGPAGALGLPVSGETDVSGVSGAREHGFQRGRIYWSSTTGGHTVNGGIYVKYIEYGGPTSALGLPLTDEYDYGSGRRSDFQGGYIYWSATTGTQVFAGTATTVTADSTYEARDAGGALLATIAPGQVASVRYSSGNYSLQAPGVSLNGSSYIRFTANGGVMKVSSYHDIPSWNPGLDDNLFRGTIEVRYSPASDAVWVVNELPLELYMRGIAETSSGVPTDFLKTMTVAARSYAVWHLDRNGKYGASEIFHLKNSRNGNGDDQQYKGYGLEARFPDLATAVTSTAGQVVTYGGSVAMTSYFSNSDGRTRSAQEVWGISTWPWLQSVADPDCAGMAMNGHGVGLSGHGALDRASRGDSYTTILGYYYTGTTVQTVNTTRNVRIAIARAS